MRIVNGRRVAETIGIVSRYVLGLEKESKMVGKGKGREKSSKMDNGSRKWV